MRQALRVAALFLLGTLLAQTAWILAVPPYRGSDEFDHVYRAGSVASGYWRPDWRHPADGRGDLIPTPRGLVEDGSAVCSSYDYVGPDNCRPVESLDGGLVTVASAAARYNPAFYWLIGKPAMVTDGVTALYVMRFMSAATSAILISMAAFTVALWARTRWPLVGLLLAMTPVLLYSTAMPAPNGVEMTGALCMWSGALGLATDRGRSRARLLLVVTATGALVLATVRSLGPLWLVLALATSLLAIGPRGLKNVLQKHPRTSAALSVVVLLGATAGGLWTITSATNSLESADLPDISPWGPSFREVPLWFFQSIAAFPLRNEPAPIVVYALETFCFIALMGGAIISGSKRIRASLVLACSLSLGVPLAITLATVQSAGLIWQGRYTMPYSVGVVMIAGLALDSQVPRFAQRQPVRAVTALVGSAGLVVSHVTSAVNVQNKESANPIFRDIGWVHVPLWCTGAMMFLSVLLWVRAVSTGSSSPQSTSAGSASQNPQVPDAQGLSAGNAART